MKLLLIGDMHVKKDNIAESEKLIDWLVILCKEQKAIPVFMGDQHDTMSIVRTEVLDFWDRAYRKFGIKQSFSLEGNHDLCPAGLTSAMTAHQELTKVITKEGFLISKKIKALGFIRDNDFFIKKCLEAHREGVEYILCHAEFQGAKYENGFYAPHGIDLSVFPETIKFISGHIHKRQKIGNKVQYIGTPRMLTRSDIGEIKGVTVMDTENFTFEFIKTPEDVAEPFVHFLIEEGDLIPQIKNSSKIFVDIVGNSDFVKKISRELPENVKARSLIKENAKQIEIKESEGLPAAFIKFSSSYLRDKGITENKEIILNEIYEKCPLLKG